MTRSPDPALSAEQERRLLAELAASVAPDSGPVLVMTPTLRRNLAWLLRFAYEQGVGAEFQDAWAAQGKPCVGCGGEIKGRHREVRDFVLCERCWT